MQCLRYLFFNRVIYLRRCTICWLFDCMECTSWPHICTQISPITTKYVVIFLLKILLSLGEVDFSIGCWCCLQYSKEIECWLFIQRIMSSRHCCIIHRIDSLFALTATTTSLPTNEMKLSKPSGAHIFWEVIKAFLKFLAWWLVSFISSYIQYSRKI